MSHLVYECDLGDWINRQPIGVARKFKKSEFVFEVELDTDPTTAKNPALIARIQEKCWKSIVPILRDSIEMFGMPDDDDYDDDEAGGSKQGTKTNKKSASKNRKPAPKGKPKSTAGAARLNADIEDAYEAGIERICTRLDKEVGPIALEVVNEAAADKASYKSYRKKAAFRIVLKFGLLGASTALTALGGWSGVGTVVGVVGLVRSAASIVQEFIKLAMDADTIRLQIEKKIDRMKRSMENAKRATNNFKEIAATVVNKVFAVEIETLVATVASVEADFQLMQQKVTGLRSRAVQASKAIYDLMDRQSEAAKALESADKILREADKKASNLDSKTVQSALIKATKAKTTADAQLKRIEAALDKVLTNVVAMMEQVNKVEKFYAHYGAEIQAVKSKYNANAVKVASVATDLVITLGSIAGADFSNTGQMVKNLHDGATKVVEALTLVNDGSQTLKDCAMTIVDAAAN